MPKCLLKPLRCKLLAYDLWFILEADVAIIMRSEALGYLYSSNISSLKDKIWGKDYFLRLTQNFNVFMYKMLNLRILKFVLFLQAS